MSNYSSSAIYCNCSKYIWFWHQKITHQTNAIFKFLKHRTSIFTFPITQITNNVGGKVYLGYELNYPVFKISKAPKITENYLLSIEWNSTRLGGPDHGIVTKTLHKNLPGVWGVGGGEGVTSVVCGLHLPILCFDES